MQDTNTADACVAIFGGAAIAITGETHVACSDVEESHEEESAHLLAVRALLAFLRAGNTVDAVCVIGELASDYWTIKVLLDEGARVTRMFLPRGGVIRFNKKCDVRAIMACFEFIDASEHDQVGVCAFDFRAPGIANPIRVLVRNRILGEKWPGYDSCDTNPEDFFGGDDDNVHGTISKTFSRYISPTRSSTPRRMRGRSPRE